MSEPTVGEQIARVREMQRQLAQCADESTHTLPRMSVDWKTESDALSALLQIVEQHRTAALGFDTLCAFAHLHPGDVTEDAIRAAFPEFDQRQQIAQERT